MNLFDVYSLAQVLHKFTQIELALVYAKLTGHGAEHVPKQHHEKAVQAFDEAELLFKFVGLDDCLKATCTARDRWNVSMLDVSAGCELLHRIQTDIVDALNSRLFLRVADDRVNLIPHMRGTTPHGGTGEIFGYPVLGAFPSAEKDIDEAGNCLAAECNTAAVFHLMRVAEVGLRALAVDRNAPFKAKPIDQQEWGTILGFLDGVIKALRTEDAKKWANPGIKDVQIRFYSEVVAELRAFNEAWRKHISHARQDAIYDRDYANSVFTHVRAFMQKLAERISENTATPEYWTQ